MSANAAAADAHGNQARGIRRLALRTAAGLVLVAAAMVMPWATYENRATRVTTNFKGGGPGLLLVALGLASIAVALLLHKRASTRLLRIHFGLGCAAWIVSIVLALSRISSANHMNGPGPSKTSFATGTVIAIVAAAAIALTSAVEIARTSRPRTLEGSGPLRR